MAPHGKGVRAEPRGGIPKSAQPAEGLDVKWTMGVDYANGKSVTVVCERLPDGTYRLLQPAAPADPGPPRGPDTTRDPRNPRKPAAAEDPRLDGWNARTIRENTAPAEGLKDAARAVVHFWDCPIRKDDTADAWQAHRLDCPGRHEVQNALRAAIKGLDVPRVADECVGCLAESDEPHRPGCRYEPAELTP